jgi:hypothetical protein
MSCIITDGYDLGCFGTGGVKDIYIANYSSSATYTLDANDIIVSASNGSTFYQFEQDIETAVFNESINPSRENGTVFYESTVGIKLFNNDATVRNLVKALAKAPLSVIILDNNGAYWFMGQDTAVRAVEGERGFGQAYGDMNGVTLSFSYKSSEPIPSIDSAIIGTDFTLG